MQVYIPSGSPLMHYTPCRFSDEGWTNGDLSASNLNLTGGDPGWFTTAEETSVSLNFTGTGLRFDIDFAAPPMPSGAGAPGSGGGGGSIPDTWTLDVTVNGTKAEELGGTSQRTPKGVVGLPDGEHQFALTLKRSDGTDGNNWARVLGATGVLNYVIADQTKNTTIDDTAWASEQIQLSDGWNMMEDGHSNYLDENDFNLERQNSSRDYNSSLSWTDRADASCTITFEGSAIWVYGISGGRAGTFDVVIDNRTMGTFDGSGGPKVYNQVLYHTAGLTDAVHNITLINKQGRLMFDYVNATSGFVDASTAPTTSTVTERLKTANPAEATPILDETASADPFPTASADPAASAKPTTNAAKDHASAHDRDNTKVIIVASVGATIGLLGLTLLVFLIWTACRRKREKNSRHAPQNEWDEDKPWYRKAMGQEKGWKFIDLPDERVGSDLGHGSSPDTRKQQTHASGSSFGSSVATHNYNNTLATPPVAHTRRSLLPFKNNLWAKEKGLPPQNERPTSASPDPMLAALGGFTSPLSQLQRTCSIETSSMDGHGHTRASPLHVSTAHTYNNHHQRSPEDADELLEFEDMPPVGTPAWYHIFGLGAPGGGGNTKRVSSARVSNASSFSNYFRRSAASSTRTTNLVTSSSNGNGNAIRLDQRHPSVNTGGLGPAAMTTGAEERSPRRRFFGTTNTNKREEIDSMWARY